VFVGLTTYFEDFYYYLDQFYQGGHGNWLTENRFSFEQYPPTLIYFNNIIFGKIGGMFGLESFQSYNLFGILLKSLFMLLAYGAIRYFFPTSLFKRIATYLIFLFSTGLPNVVLQNGGNFEYGHIDLFRTGNHIFSRFGTSANDMFNNSIFVILCVVLVGFFIEELHWSQNFVSSSKTSDYFWMRFVKVLVFILPFFVLLTIGDLFKSIALLGLMIILYLKYRIQKKSFYIYPHTLGLILILIGVISLVSLYIVKTVNVDPVYEQAVKWDVYMYFNHIKGAGFVNYVKGFGLMMPLFFYGYWALLAKKQKSMLEESALILSAICVGGYIVPVVFRIPISGFRFMFSAFYIVIAVIIWYAIEALSERFHKKQMDVVLIVVYLAINIVSIVPQLYKDYQPVKEPEFHFAYIPNDLYKGLVFLRTAEPRDAIILGSPHTSIDLMIPGIAGRYTYSGHFLTTYNAKEKDILANKFYYDWIDQTNPQVFLRQNNIRFVIVTKYSAVLDRIRTYYSFLKPVFENSEVTIFRYDLGE